MTSRHSSRISCISLLLTVFVGCSGDGGTPADLSGSGGDSTGGATSDSGSGGSASSTGGTAAGTGGTAAGTGGTAAGTGGTAPGTGGDDGLGSGGDVTGSGGVIDGSGGDTNTGGADAGTGGESMATGGTDSGVTPSAGCGTSPTMESGSHTIQVDGQDRSFMMRLPDNYDSNQPHRLVFAFHWNGGSMNDVDGGGSSGYSWSYYGLREQAGDSTIFVAPQGINAGWGNNAGRDLAFVDEMVGQIKGDLCVDEERVFSMGFSYGGGMTYALACDRADIFRAVAVYGGAVLSGCGDGSQPVAYLGIHGLSDFTCEIPVGRSMRDRFVENNGCTPQNPPEPNGGSGTYTCTSYEGCTDGPVRWCAFDGGHTPGHVDGGGDDGALTWTKGEAWDFFSQF